MESWMKSNLKNENIVLSSSVRLSRNLEKIPFPNKLVNEKGKELVEEIFALLKSNNNNKQFIFYKTWENDEELTKLYIEKNCIDNDILTNKNKSGFILESNCEFSFMINGEDHIKMQVIKKGFNLYDAFKEISFIDDFIDNKISYAFNQELGYLTENPIKTGTAMKALVVIHLPAITLKNEIPCLIKELSKIGIEIKCLNGNIYEVSNVFSLNLSEKEIINNLKAVTRKLMVKEKNARIQLWENNEFEIKDKIFRALGILQKAFVLDLKESLNLISFVRFGVEISLIDNVEIRKLDELINEIKSLNIQISLKKKLSQKEIEIERARILRESLNY